MYDSLTAPNCVALWGVELSKDMHNLFWCGNLNERGYLEDPDVDGRIVLNWILSK
jgi:hypothetical protein